MSEHSAENDVLTVTVRADDLRAVLQAADYMNDRTLLGPVDRMGDALALTQMQADLRNEEHEHTAEDDAPREHYLYINMRDRGCNCGVRYHDVPRDRAALEAAHAAHLASVIPPGTGVATLCDLCDEPLEAEDDVRHLGSSVASGKAHRECLLRAVVGGIGHHEDHALWCGERGDPDGGRTYRASALEVDALYATGVTLTGVTPPGSSS